MGWEGVASRYVCDAMQVYSGSLYVACPPGASAAEFEARKREWILYESVRDLEETFQSVLQAKNQAMVRALRERESRRTSRSGVALDTWVAAKAAGVLSAFRRRVQPSRASLDEPAGRLTN